jgi:hypothetical protein
MNDQVRRYNELKDDYSPMAAAFRMDGETPADEPQDTAPWWTPAPEPGSPAYWAARIVTRHPHLARPVAQALALVEAGHVSGDDIHTQVINAERKVIYHQGFEPALGQWVCNCKAYEFRAYRTTGRFVVCKHILAIRIAERAGLLEKTQLEDSHAR